VEGLPAPVRGTVMNPVDPPGVRRGQGKATTDGPRGKPTKGYNTALGAAVRSLHTRDTCGRNRDEDRSHGTVARRARTSIIS